VLTAPFGAFTLVDDAYNANPASVAAALEALKLRAPTASGRRIAALGDMLELGDRAGAYHAGLALPVAEAEVDLVFCAGPHMKALWDALPPHRRGGYAESADSLTPVLLAALRAGDVVLVKGSNGSKMWRVVEALQHLAGL
jgi:UDP-N-acetylmuramoyl-tripeptide--D-alanyl-D-alanine ligase